METVEINGEKIEICERTRFTQYLPEERRGELESWRAWFAERGINAAIAGVPGSGFAVFRNGLVSEDKK